MLPITDVDTVLALHAERLARLRAEAFAAALAREARGAHGRTWPWQRRRSGSRAAGRRRLDDTPAQPATC
jgi:hypothetical protein